MTQEEYERRRAEFYQNKYEQNNYSVDQNAFQIPDDSISTIELQQSQKAQNQKNSVIYDRDGSSMRSSNVMLKKDYSVDDGKYLNSGEVLEAFDKYFSSDEPNKIVVCKRDGRRVSKSDLKEKILTVLDKAGGIVVGGKNEKITNQNSAKYHFYDEDPKNRTFMLGNKGIELPSGNYIRKEELQKALSEYMVADKKEEEKEKYAVIAKKPSKWKIKPLIAAALITGTIILSGLGLNKKVDTNAVYNVTQTEIVQNIDENKQDTFANLVTGSKINVQKNLEYFHESDQATNIHGVFGEPDGYRPAGEYDLEYISVVHNNEIVDVAYDQGVNVDDFVKQTAASRGFDADEAKVMVHLGGPVSGWSDLDEITSGYGMSTPIIHTELQDVKYFEGVQENFNGNITLEEYGKEPVTMSLVDTEGNIVEKGTLVKGSDGVDYRVNNLEVIEKDAGYSINWSINNIINRKEIVAGATLAAGALGLIAGTKKEKDDEEAENTKEETNLKVENNPKKDNASKEEAFNTAKNNYQKQSKFNMVASYINSKINQFDKKMAQINNKIIAALPINNSNDGMGRHM